ncbi:hypothetical protein FQA39_LY12286 [Lamprigera yunnana]|nr:hypothetical protein FQA39_LY12286 [Lamprigera yunnana]
MENTLLSIQVVKHLRSIEEKTLEKPNITLEDGKFSFEVVPNTKPWYRAFQHQDIAEQCYTCYNYCSRYKPFLLPYEMDPLLPINPKVCYYAYNKMKIDLLDGSGPSTSETCSTPDISAANTLKIDYNSSTGEDSNEDLSTDIMEHCRKHKVTERRTKYNLQQEVEPDYDELTKDVADMLLNAYKDIKMDEDQLDEGVNVHCRSSAVLGRLY